MLISWKFMGFPYKSRYYNTSLEALMPRLDLIHVARIQVVSTCIPCRRLHVSCIGDKIIVTATCIHLYPLIVSGYKLLVRDTCIPDYCVSGVKRFKTV